MGESPRKLRLPTSVLDCGAVSAPDERKCAKDRSPSCGFASAGEFGPFALTRLDQSPPEDRLRSPGRGSGPPAQGHAAEICAHLLNPLGPQSQTRICCFCGGPNSCRGIASGAFLPRLRQNWPTRFKCWPELAALCPSLAKFDQHCPRLENFGPTLAESWQGSTQSKKQTQNPGAGQTPEWHSELPRGTNGTTKRAAGGTSRGLSPRLHGHGRGTGRHPPGTPTGTPGPQKGP